MVELIAHLVGDYALQNQYMADRKTSSWGWASLHVALYMLPFLALTRSWPALAVMAGTHLIIDRFRLARYWVRFWGVGQAGRLPSWFRGLHRRHYTSLADLIDHEAAVERFGADLLTRDALEAEFEEAFPPVETPPDFLAVWLLIVVDNTFHLLINHLALAYLP
jgi:hypothetical protein